MPAHSIVRSILVHPAKLCFCWIPTLQPSSVGSSPSVSSTGDLDAEPDLAVYSAPRSSPERRASGEAGPSNAHQQDQQQQQQEPLDPMEQRRREMSKQKQELPYRLRAVRTLTRDPRHSTLHP